jgi:hypothetical protein
VPALVVRCEARLRRAAGAGRGRGAVDRHPLVRVDQVQRQPLPLRAVVVVRVRVVAEAVLAVAPRPLEMGPRGLRSHPPLVMHAGIAEPPTPGHAGVTVTNGKESARSGTSDVKLSRRLLTTGQWPGDEQPRQQAGVAAADSLPPRSVSNAEPRSGPVTRLAARVGLIDRCVDRLANGIRCRA